MALRESKDLDRRESRDVRLLLKEENKDRKQLYGEVAKASSLEVKMIPRIGQLFSVKWQKKCKPGWWIQDKKGKWSKKKPEKKKKK